MIRIFNLFCKLKEIKISDQEWFDQALHRLSLSERRCPYCNSKGNLIPYSSYSLRFVLTVLESYFLHAHTVEEICETYQIAHSTLCFRGNRPEICETQRAEKRRRGTGRP